MSDDLLKEPLPEPWTFGVTKDGRVFFINDDENRTTWLHPDTKQPAMTGFHRPSDLPSGWEQGYSQDGDVYYINHNTQKTTFNDPRVYTAENEQKDSAALKKKKRRSSFTETLTRPLFRRSSSKSRNKPEKMHVREKRPSSAKRSNSFSGSKGIKMTVVRRDPNATATRSGWLYKQDSSGIGGMKIWRKRWFILSDFCLFYYKDSREDEALGSIILPSYAVNTVNPEDKIHRKYAFKIEHPGMRTYYICAESYNDMAEWVTDLNRICTFKTNRSGSRKSLDSSKPTDEEQAFGFVEPKRQSKSLERESSSSTPSSIKKESHLLTNGNNNAKVSTSSSPSRGEQKQRRSSSRLPRSSSASNRTPTSSLSSSSNQPKRLNSVPPKNSASDRGQPRYTQQQINRGHYSDASTPENRRQRANQNVGRTNSMAKLGNWVQTQKTKQQHNTMSSNKKHLNPYDNASEMSSASSPAKRIDVYYHTGPRPGHQRAPTSGKRYKPGTYSDYMDSAEVASSIMSVPPMYRNKVTSLPRPRSSQDIDDDRGRRKKLSNSKSVGYIVPDHFRAALQTKSEYNLSPQPYSASSKSPLSADSMRRGNDDVFSPIGSNTRDHRRFKYESASAHRTPSFHAAISPTAPSTSTYEVKQVNVQGSQGHLRAFAISSRTPNTTVVASTQHHSPPAGGKENQVSSEKQIENKLNRLHELDQALQKLFKEIEQLQKEKRILEQSLNRAKSSHAIGIGSEFELEQKLTRVKSKLANSSQKLKEFSRENEAFETEIKKMKMKLLEQLNRKMETKSNQRQLEWELGRIQLIMEGVSKNKSGLVQRLNSFNDESFESDISQSNSARDGSTKRISSTMPRSPRDVKRHSNDRHSSGSPYARVPSSSSVSQESKYFTLPGRGVSRATSVDSLTAASIARFTRPSSARSATSLHRTKSAAERLLSGSHGNLGPVQDPDEVKKIQREINLNRLRTLNGETVRRSVSSRSVIPTASTHMQVGIDVQMAIKNHRMPKVLQRAKRDMQRAEAERKPLKRDYEIGFDIDRFEEDATDEHPDNLYINDEDLSPGVTELDVEPEDIQVDLNLTHQLIAPDKVDIPDRLLEYEDVKLTPAEERQKQKKIRAIESMLSRSGQTASKPTVHLAAALAAEAGTVARAVAYQAQQQKEMQPMHPSFV